MEYWTNELYHHGIKGQKWGVRRYQNLDRTLTPEGKIRYGKKHPYPEVHTNKRYQRALDKDIDFSSLSKEEKAKKESELMKRWKLDPDQWDRLSDRERDQVIRLQKKIETKSGDFYRGKGVSEGFRKGLGDYNRAREESDRIFKSYRKYDDEMRKADADFRAGKISERKWLKVSDKYFKAATESYNNAINSKEFKDNQQKINSIVDRLCATALKDIGYENTKQARDLMYFFLIYG